MDGWLGNRSQSGGQAVRPVRPSPQAPVIESDSIPKLRHVFFLSFLFLVSRTYEHARIITTIIIPLSSCL